MASEAILNKLKASEAIFGINRFNSKKQREGRWRFYWYDNVHKGLADLYAEGYYINDQEVGLWKYYDKKGNLTREEIHIE